MAYFNKEEKMELQELANSSELREDMRKLSINKFAPLITDGKVDIDKYIKFLTEFNWFTNHTSKPFRKIIDNDMRL